MRIKIYESFALGIIKGFHCHGLFLRTLASGWLPKWSSRQCNDRVWGRCHQERRHCKQGGALCAADPGFRPWQLSFMDL